MKINPNTPEIYQDLNGRQVEAITELKIPIVGYSHVIHFDFPNWDYWNESCTDIEEIRIERWQGISFNKKGLLNDYDNKVYGSLDSLRHGTILAPYTHAIDLGDLQIVKL